ncbi:fructosamine kinase family protein [Lentilactobacillus farraginis]|uniref:Fructosamine-3-kinase n=1 Tax=Lentilactobacillus farraginis DSM 18382 = JCM 14108 TaxID=1423743 RepID=X0PG38_9LACO|nr:fructosamine kinase family protein [Lentilactobacillus farraginis]KRM08450.1 fructosamine-3-kinase [Lentilactobacillus farraginis DSM 18382 = JCM 14108]GAF35907.1 fructosamine-3-kinase [Lentilactobacillus farraginis DSM 18382 = JCM 14108]
MNPELLDQLPIPKIVHDRPVGGGDINEAFKLTDQNGGRYFLLIQPNHSKDFFKHEVTGLQLLAQTVLTPKVLAWGSFGKDAYLLLSYVNHQPAGDQFEMGRQLAKLHKRRSPNKQYGFNENFTMGTYTADNTWQPEWESFFVNQRLAALKKLIQQRNLWTSEMETLYARAIKVFKKLMKDYHPLPSLLHGDLWSGNFMFNQDGKPVFIDPAVFYGDREFDLGITHVFGGFTTDFYEGYKTEYPLERGSANRLPFYQLYYLMFHLSQFGAGYQGSVLQMLALCAGK